MASNFMANIPEDFDIQAMAQDLADLYMTKGYTARAMKMKNGARIVIQKGVGGLNTIFGMGEGITVTIMKQGADTLVATFSNGDWVSKIIGCVVGLFCCIPFITSIIGLVKQLSLPKDIENDISVLINDGEK